MCPPSLTFKMTIWLQNRVCQAFFRLTYRCDLHTFERIFTEYGTYALYCPVMRKIDPNNFRVATRATPRQINRQIALNLVRARQPISRADLARLMQMRRGAVSLLVNELIEEGIIFEGATGETSRGRKPK